MTKRRIRGKGVNEIMLYQVKWFYILVDHLWSDHKKYVNIMQKQCFEEL